MTKCIYCGLCQEACPVDAIVEVSFLNITLFIFPSYDFFVILLIYIF